MVQGDMVTQEKGGKKPNFGLLQERISLELKYNIIVFKNYSRIYSYSVL